MKFNFKKTIQLGKAFAALSLSVLSGQTLAADFPKELRVDFAYYSPSSLVLKNLAGLSKI